MTRIEVHIDRLVLRGVPAELTEGLAPLVELRLAELATADRRGQPPPGTTPARRREAAVDTAGLAARIARDIWSAARPRTDGEVSG